MKIPKFLTWVCNLSLQLLSLITTSMAVASKVIYTLAKSIYLTLYNKLHYSIYTFIHNVRAISLGATCVKQHRLEKLSSFWLIKIVNANLGELFRGSYLGGGITPSCLKLIRNMLEIWNLVFLENIHFITKNNN